MAASHVDARIAGVVSVARLAQRVLTSAGSRPVLDAALRTVIPGAETRPRRSAMAPAAVRVERSRSRGRHGEVAEQTALTMWFGDGPALPGPGAGRGRVVAGTALAVAGAAALGAATYIANQREAARLPAAHPAEEPRRIAG